VKNGITSADTQTLETVEQTAAKIEAAADELAPMLNAKGDAFAQVKSRAQELASEAHAVRTENYQTQNEVANRDYNRTGRTNRYPTGTGTGGGTGGSRGSGGGTGTGAGTPGQLGH
jgi:hypothetical protein